MERVIVHENGRYKVWQVSRSACSDCRTGWSNGTLAPYAVSGVKCTHGRGSWQVGQVGPRGGWYAMSPTYGSERAAVLVCDALAEALNIPAQGVS
jgi:hypothetical protein